MTFIIKIKNMKKKHFLVLILAIIIVLSTTLLINHYSQSKAQPEIIKIGVTIPLSGKYAYIGQEIANGLQMAAEEINNQSKLNNNQIKLIIEDNKGETTEAINSVNKFINVDRVEIVISTFTHITSAIKELTKANNKILFYMSTTPVFAQESKYIFRDYFDAADSGRKIAEAVKAKGFQGVALLTEISEQGQIIEDSFKAAANELGLQIVVQEEVPADLTDLKTSLLKLNLPNADVLVTDNWRQEHILMTQLKELDLLGVPTFHIVAPYLPISNTPEMKAIYQENQAISTWYGMAEATDKEKQIEFKVKYKLKYDQEPTADAAYAYDDIYLIAQALKMCDFDAADKDCFSQAIVSSQLDGVGGHLEFDQDGVSKRYVPLIQVLDGKWQEIEL